MATGDRPPPRPSRPLPPRGGGGAPAPKPAGRPSGTAPAADDRVAAAYKDLLQEIVEKKKKQAEVRSRPKPKRKGPVIKAVLAVILPPIAAAVWIFQPFAPGPPPPVRPPDERGAWFMALSDAALRIREWRDSAGRFPPDLATAEIHLAGVEFTVDGPEQFTLQTFTSEGLVIVWMDQDLLGTGPKPIPVPDSTIPPPPL